MSGLNSLDKVLSILDLFTEDRLEWTPEEMMRELIESIEITDAPE